MGINRAKLVAYLNHCILTVPQEEGIPCTAIELMHKEGLGEGTRVCRWPIGQNQDIGKLSSNVIEWAENDAAGHPTIQSYYLRSFYKGSEIPEDRFAFMEGKVQAGVNGMGAGEFGSVPTGELGGGGPAMLMAAHRHTEFAMQHSAQLTEMALARAERECQRLSEANERLQRQVEDFWIEKQDMLDRKAERDERARKQQFKNDMMMEGFQVVKPIAQFALGQIGQNLIGGKTPVQAAKLATPGTFPVEFVILVESLKHVFVTFDNDKISAIVNSNLFTQEEMMGMHNTYKSYQVLEKVRAEKPGCFPMAEFQEVMKHLDKVFVHWDQSKITQIRDKGIFNGPEIYALNESLKAYKALPRENQESTSESPMK